MQGQELYGNNTQKIILSVKIIQSLKSFEELTKQ